jgi:hypothetical protein
MRSAHEWTNLDADGVRQASSIRPVSRRRAIGQNRACENDGWVRRRWQSLDSIRPKLLDLDLRLFVPGHERKSRISVKLVFCSGVTETIGSHLIGFFDRNGSRL